MSMSQFNNIRVVLAEPNSQLRGGLKESLEGSGFNGVVVTGNLSRVVTAVNQGTVDLLIADASLPEGDFNAYVSELRHGQHGDNPFLVVITLVSEPSRDAVHNAINSGTDHVLAKPFTIEALIEKIVDLTQTRKRFVVTGDYVGPDRRLAHREGTMQIPLIDVPNPLRHRMSGHISKTQIKLKIENAKRKINEHKVERHAFQVGWLLDDVMFEISNMNRDGAPASRQNLQRLVEISNDICARIQNTCYAHLSEMCLTLSNMAEMAMQGALNKADIELMGRMAQIMGHAFDPDRDVKAIEYQRKSRSGTLRVFKNTEVGGSARSEMTVKELVNVSVA